MPGSSPGMTPEITSDVSDRLLGTQLRFRHAAGQQIENERHPDARAANARLAGANRRVDADAVKEVCHGGFQSSTMRGSALRDNAPVQRCMAA